MRFEALGKAIGPRFEGTTLPDFAANPETKSPPHSVVTRHLVDRQGEPTRKAVDEILTYFKMRLT